MSETQKTSPFINYLYALADLGNRGALADLRRGLSGPPGTTPAMYPYVASWVPDDARNTWLEKNYYLIAALFAFYQSGSGGHSLRTDTGNFGDHCRQLLLKEKQSASFETRFTSLLKSHWDDLPALLRQVLSLLKGGAIAINWHQLFYDLQHWNSPSQYVQSNWSHGYWAYRDQQKSEITKQ